jgi:hypothetical protein
MKWIMNVLQKRNSLGNPQITIYSNPVGGVKNIVAHVFGRTVEDVEINAAIIKAAPEMLEALKYIAGWDSFRDHPLGRRAINCLKENDLIK